MAYSNKLYAALLIFSFLLDSSTFSDACSTCKPAIPPPSPPACPPPPSAKTPPKVPSPKPKTPTPSPKPKTPPSPKPKAPTPSPSMESCPRDTLKLGVCADLLGLVNVQLGSPASSPCCTLLEGLTDLEAAICLCTALKASVLGINLNVPISLGVLISACQKDLPPDFQCK